jgi:hypothetical protein
MARDLETQSSAVLPVTLFGNDADGKPFLQFVTAHNLTNSGALLQGVEQRLEPGGIFGLRCNERQARARVVWMCESELGPSMQVCLQLLPTERCPWEATLEAAARKRQNHGERRSHPRYTIAMMVELSEPRTGVNIQARTADMSSRGCYIRTIITLPVGTRVNVAFSIHSTRLELAAVVRTAEPGAGMGMEFTEITAEQESLIALYLKSSGVLSRSK